MSFAVLAIRVANKAACPKSKPLSLFYIIQSLKEGNFGCLWIEIPCSLEGFAAGILFLNKTQFGKGNDQNERQ